MMSSVHDLFVPGASGEGPPRVACPVCGDDYCEADMDDGMRERQGALVCEFRCGGGHRFALVIRQRQGRSVATVERLEGGSRGRLVG